MFRLFAVGLEQRLFDVAVAVAVLLAVAALCTRIVWQPAKRLSIIQWALMGGLVLACGIFCPWNVVSLGVWRSANPNWERVVSSSSMAENGVLSSGNPGDFQSAVRAEIRALKQHKSVNPPAVEMTLNSGSIVVQAEPPANEVHVARTDSFRSWMRLIGIIYAFGALGMLCWFAIGQWAVSRLVYRATSSNMQMNRLWGELRQELSNAVPRSQRGEIQLLISNDVAFPVAVGVFRSAVLLPRWLVDSFEVEQLRPVLAHELAHVLRYDAQLRWCASLFQVVFFYQPFYWWLRRELRLCQEYLADALAASSAKSRSEYAAQLLAIMRAAPDCSCRPSSAIGILEGRSELYRRIQMLVKSTRPLTLDLDRRWNAVAATALIGFATALGLITLRADDSPPVAGSTVPSQATASPAPIGTRNHQPKAGSPVKNALGEPVVVLIVNSKGEPVAGAKLKLSGFTPVYSSSVTLDEEKFPPEITESDAEGKARILIPEAATDLANRFMQELIAQGLQRLQIQIDHRSHPVRWQEISVGQNKPVVLADSTTVEIRAFRNDNRKPVHGIWPEIGRQLLDAGENNGLLTIRRLDITSPQATRALRIVHFLESGPAWFSDLIELKPAANNLIVVNAELKPGVRLEGKLDVQVTRPIKNGRVFATLVSRQNALLQGYWEAETAIAADGTFVFESLPANEEAQLVALCDGWVNSPPSPVELKGYSQRMGFKEIDEPNLDSGNVFPRLCRLNAAKIQTSIPMHRTATCEITVLDADGNGLAGAFVGFPVNQIYYQGGTGLIGNGGDRLAILRSELKTGQHRKTPAANSNQVAYTAQTNEHGVAVISHIPVGKESQKSRPAPVMLLVQREGYETINRSMPSFPFGPQILQVKLLPGKTEKLQIRMREKVSRDPNPGDDEAAVDESANAAFSPEDDPFQEPGASERKGK
jgi:beta-lactamase regulating signal transducer with metallopeptidase domain